jgi:hypothetical protein
MCDKLQLHGRGLKFQLVLLQQMTRSNNLYRCIVIITYVIIYNYWYVAFTISWGMSDVTNLGSFCLFVMWTFDGCRLSSSWTQDVMGILFGLPFPFWREVDKITVVTAGCDDYVRPGYRIPPGGPPCLHIPTIARISYVCKCYVDDIELLG